MSRMTPEETRKLGLASMGATLEYEDFVVFVFVAAALGKAMFPSGSSAWLLRAQVFGIYAVGSIFRPIAGLVIGIRGPGRAQAAAYPHPLSRLPTFLMGLLPTYRQIGVGAPTLLIRQGCAGGGELPSAAVFMTEHARSGRLFFASGLLSAAPGQPNVTRARTTRQA